MVRMGARQAKAGEFSQRAFLNDKIDLAQAEAIADLINSSTEQAALGAMRSLQGEFSKKIDDLLVKLIFLRSYVEAAIDFPEEEIDFLADDTVQTKLSELRLALDTCLQQTQQGAILKNGFTLVLAGKPNAGKSSLLNYLSGLETAIVTEIPGTTRDIVSQTIDIDGLPVHVLDTAGLRDTNDPVEKIGVAKAQKAIEEADHILVLQDINDKEAIDIELPQDKLTQINTKLDLQPQQSTGEDAIGISIIDGTGIEELKTHIKKLAGFHSDGETLFTARRRHIAALEQASDALNQGIHQLETNKAGELLAEELLAAQNAINEITGEFKSDDLLGQIFGSFCIGK
ncbi:MAG: tRNA uridine-5-carboxymethylaminomethyl(34) synthesis GTPase MnmE [Pseudomonadota bacterium]